MADWWMQKKSCDLLTVTIETLASVNNQIYLHFFKYTYYINISSLSKDAFSDFVQHKGWWRILRHSPMFGEESSTNYWWRIIFRAETLVKDLSPLWNIGEGYPSPKRYAPTPMYHMVPPLEPMTSPVNVIWPDGHTCIIGPWAVVICGDINTWKVSWHFFVPRNFNSTFSARNRQNKPSELNLVLLYIN